MKYTMYHPMEIIDRLEKDVKSLIDKVRADELGRQAATEATSGCLPPPPPYKSRLQRHADIMHLLGTVHGRIDGLRISMKERKLDNGDNDAD